MKSFIKFLVVLLSFSVCCGLSYADDWTCEHEAFVDYLNNLSKERVVLLEEIAELGKLNMSYEEFMNKLEVLMHKLEKPVVYDTCGIFDGIPVGSAGYRRYKVALDSLRINEYITHWWYFRLLSFYRSLKDYGELGEKYCYNSDEYKNLLRFVRGLNIGKLEHINEIESYVNYLHLQKLYLLKEQAQLYDLRRKLYEIEKQLEQMVNFDLFIQSEKLRSDIKLIRARINYAIIKLCMRDIPCVKIMLKNSTAKSESLNRQINEIFLLFLIYHKFTINSFNF